MNNSRREIIDDVGRRLVENDFKVNLKSWKNDFKVKFNMHKVEEFFERELKDFFP